MSKLMITNGAVSVRANGRTIGEMVNALKTNGAKYIKDSNINRLLSGKALKSRGFSLALAKKHARTENSEREFRVTPEYFQAKHAEKYRLRGRYAVFLEQIELGNQTLSKLVSKFVTAKNPLNAEKELLWLRHEISRAISAGMIVEIVNNKVLIKNSKAGRKKNVVEPEVIES
jgi:hypothetical protein